MVTTVYVSRAWVVDVLAEYTCACFSLHACYDFVIFRSVATKRVSFREVLRKALPLEEAPAITRSRKKLCGDPTRTRRA